MCNKNSPTDITHKNRPNSHAKDTSKFDNSLNNETNNIRYIHTRSKRPWVLNMHNLNLVLCILLTVGFSDAVILNSRGRQIGLQPRCRDVRIQDATKMADVVVSGKVRKLMTDAAHSDNNHVMFKGEVEVKRVFKGGQVVDKMATIKPGRLRPHKMVMVEGFGDPGICHNDVRERDTKIFLLKPNGNGELKLNSSIVTLTLRNLDYVDAAVQNVVFTEEKPKEISPCYLYFCPFGATCHVNKTSRQPMCVCEQKCSRVFAPVCGSDGATYSNQCMMDRMSCIRNRKIRLINHGKCRARDPCEGKVCRYGAECMPSQNGETYRCQCPSECHTYGDSQGSKPVCGNNGKDYPNICELRKDACTTITEIRVKYYGKCDPCEGVTCSEPKQCQVRGPNRTPSCECAFLCHSELNFVCGTDGKTYSNVCLLRQQACLSRRDIKKLHSGKCNPENNPCRKLQCGPQKECAIDKDTGRANCVCPPACEPVLRRVCGNDSVTYDNVCELRRRACQAGVYTVVAKQGACGSRSPCDGHQCHYGAMCVEHSGHPMCECPQCTAEYSPVCGENGITYENECKLRQENCHREERVKVAKTGTCDDGCGDQRCEFYAVCENSRNGPQCVCPTSCVKVYAPVCGNDGVTYSNECELRVESCRRKTFLTIASTGTCDKCKGIRCDFHAKCENGACVCPMTCPAVREPVCATNERTFLNECEMRKHACVNSQDIQVSFMGECAGDNLAGGSGDGCDDEDDAACGSGDDNIDIFIGGGRGTPTTTSKPAPCSVDNCVAFGGSCELQGVDLICRCDFKCGSESEPVCGTDGRMYHNKCDMSLASCTKREHIHSQALENCDEFDNDEPCGGSVPLVNPTTGAEYDCNPGQDTCPQGSYCHYNLQFAKCCQDIDNKPVVPLITECSQTEFGCCKDGVTPAKGAGEGGCPDECRCNTLGSYTTTCDPYTKQCTCKPGVGGKKCDRCEIGYFGMNRIAHSGSGNAGCIPCNCNKFGSDRDDCNQNSGRCMCKPMITGMKCDRCPDGREPGPAGCSDHTPSSTSCDSMTCLFGATCREGINGQPAECTCDLDCSNHGNGNSHNDYWKSGGQSAWSHNDIVCGTDGQNYGSECQLRTFACRLGQNIGVAHRGPCQGSPPSPVTTASPVTRSRKTTRHTDGIDGNRDNKDKADNSSGDDKGTRPREEEDKECTVYNIEDLCLDNSDCCPDNSQCRNGLCYCQDGFSPSLDNLQCFEVKPVRPGPAKNVTDACTINPCEAGTCVIDKLLGFRCECPLGRAGTLCDKDMEFTVPSFSGRSHLELPRLEGANQALSIEVQFSTLNNDGIILFNAKFKNGSGDFVSLAIKDGYVEFRYDLGGGPAILRSRERVERASTHRVIAHREKAMGSLVVDNDDAVRGSAPFTHLSLDLNDPLYLGFLPGARQEIYKRIGVNVGLNGCVTSLKAGERRDNMKTFNLRLNSAFTDIVSGVDVVECDTNPCYGMPCQHDGTCLVLDKHAFECRCKKGYTGLQCENIEDPCASEPCQHGGRCAPMLSADTFFCHCPSGREGLFCERESIPEVYVPQFTGDSYMELALPEMVSKTLKITVWFMSQKPDGVLLFATQNSDGSGDFISLNLVDKKLVFTFFLGSGLGTIETSKHIKLNKWHEVTIDRMDKQGSMTIDDHPPVTGVAQGSSTMLNMGDRPLYLGGFRNREDVPVRSGINKGFVGAVQRMTINGRAVEGLMSSALAMTNISTYNGPPCDKNPCMNGGVCVPMLNKAECRCPSGYVGERCGSRFNEETDLGQPIQFDGMSYISYHNEIDQKQEGQRENEFFIKFRTNQPNGILLLQTGGNTVNEDYLLLAVQDSHVVFSYNLGKQGLGNLHVMESKVNVKDGDWHTVKVIRQEREGTLQVDDEDPIVDFSANGAQQLDTDGLLWLGGKGGLPWGLPVTTPLEGCVAEVKINGRSLRLVADKIDDPMMKSTALTFCTDVD